jgi:two-component system sensor histidine kinase RegB
MPAPALPPQGLPPLPPVGRVRLRTLVVVRWIAVFGQACAVLGVHYGLGYQLPIGAAMGAVAVSAILNAVLMLDRPRAGRLDDRAAGAVLAYDILQLGTLLHFTGGLQNPFAVLLVAPVAVAATSLTRSSTVALGVLSMATASVLPFWHEPLPWAEPGLELPTLFSFGVWLAVAMTIVVVAANVAKLAEDARQMSDALAAAQTSLEREQRVSAVGGLAAAAAHELGTPLATIALVAKEVARDAPPGALKADAELLLRETMRCRDILARLAAKPESGDAHGDPFPRPPLSVLLREIGARYAANRVEVAVTIDYADNVDPPAPRRPDLVQALGTLIDNASSFAHTRIDIRAWSDAQTVGIDIHDDGPGFAPEILTRLGEPYVSSRVGESDHMGLGVFIASTLLARMSASVAWANAPHGGARIVVTWPRSAFAALSEKKLA